MSGKYDPQEVFIHSGILAEEVEEKICETYDPSLDYIQLAEKAEQVKIELYQNNKEFACLEGVMAYLGKTRNKI